VGDPLDIRPVFTPQAAGSYTSHVVLLSALTPRQCDRIVALGEELRLDDGQLASDTPPDSGLRRSKVAWIEPTADTAWLFDKLARLAHKANRSYGFDLSGFGEDLQYTVYDEPGAFYTWHQDGLTGEVATRKLAIVVQLSEPDDYEGADLELFDAVADLAPAELAAANDERRGRGTAVAFPAFEYHRVTPLVSGVRRSLVVWVSGPPFR
jgi:PKHD-type hydroxylase